MVSKRRTVRNIPLIEIGRSNPCKEGKLGPGAVCQKTHLEIDEKQKTVALVLYFARWQNFGTFFVHLTLINGGGNRDRTRLALSVHRL